jgi:transcriptional regulator with XRE-family HTH domain
MSELIDELKNEFRDEEYRYAFDEDFANARMAMQIKVIREEQEMTQAKLAELAGMKQTRISALENINYSSWSVSTLRRLAKALGVRFSFKFEGWGNLLHESDSLSRESLNRPSFEKDLEFKDTETHELEPEPIAVDHERLDSTLKAKDATAVSDLTLNLSDDAGKYWDDQAQAVSEGTVEPTSASANHQFSLSKASASNVIPFRLPTPPTAPIMQQSNDDKQTAATIGGRANTEVTVIDLSARAARGGR